MEKGDIIAGLSQAILRGDSLERAKQSFINAGYSKKDVEDSANSLDNSVSSMTTNLPTIQIPHPKSTQKLPQIPQYNQNIKSEINPPIQQENNLPPIPQPSQKQDNKIEDKKKPRRKKSKIFLFLLFLLIVFGAFLLYVNIY
jgi:predicted nucleic acid-binding Zn ribbon protein